MSPNNPKKYRGRAKGSRKIIILLEHEEQVKNCLKRLKEIKGQKLIIALSPFAMYELDKRGVQYKIPEDYYNPKELYKLGIKNYKKVENICSMIDKSIQNACPTLAKLNIKPALFSFYHLKNIYDAATIRLFQLSKLIDAEKPDILYVYDTKRYPFGISEMAPYLFFDNRESIYARLLNCKGWDMPVVVLPFVPQPEDFDFSKKPYEKRLMLWLRRHPKFFDLAAETRKHGLRGFFNKLKSGLLADGDLQVLLFGAGYNWDDCRKELQSVGINPVFIRIWDNLERWISNQISTKLSVDALSDAWEGLRADDEFRKFFIWGNVDFLSVLEERLRFLIKQLSPTCLNVYEETARIIEKREVKALLASTFASCTGHSASRAARNSNIPVVTWQHGGYGYMNQQMIAYNDLMSSDVHFVFGEGVVKKYSKAARRFGTRLVAIGSPSLETLFQMLPPSKCKKIVKSTSEKKVVLYASTNFYQNNLYVSSPPPFSDNHFWHTQQAILEVLAKHRDYTIVVKTHPSRMYRESPMRLHAKENKFGNVRFVKDECTFTDLLPTACLFVIDFPSTTLLEALTTSKPIFVYTGHLHPDNRALKLLERRAFCYRELKELVNALDRYLSDGRIDKRVDLNDKEFLKAYGISSQGKGSGMRAAKMLKEIISGVGK